MEAVDHAPRDIADIACKSANVVIFVVMIQMLGQFLKSFIELASAFCGS